MTTIRNTLAVLAGLAAPTPSPSTQARECGSVNVFYTGFPYQHPLVAAQGWDPTRVDRGLRNDTVNLVKAGYNVQVVWAGTEVPISTLEQRMDEKGDFDVFGIGYGMRGADIPEIVQRFEDLVEFYKQKSPDVPIVFNYNPESIVWSVAHRVPLREDCEAVGKPGKLFGYEEIYVPGAYQSA